MEQREGCATPESMSWNPSWWARQSFTCCCTNAGYDLSTCSPSRLNFYYAGITFASSPSDFERCAKVRCCWSLSSCWREHGCSSQCQDQPGLSSIGLSRVLSLCLSTECHTVMSLAQDLIWMLNMAWQVRVLCAVGFLASHHLLLQQICIEWVVHLFATSSQKVCPFLLFCSNLDLLRERLRDRDCFLHNWWH